MGGFDSLIPKDDSSTSEAPTPTKKGGFDHLVPKKSSSPVTSNTKEEPTNTEEPKTTAVGSAMRGFATGVGPGAVGISVGEMATAAAAPLGPLAPVAGVVAGAGASLAASYVQSGALDKLEQSSPFVKNFLTQFGMDSETRARGEQEHPYATAVGGVGSGGVFGSVKGTLGQRALGAGVSTALEGAQQIYAGKGDATALGIAAAGGAAFPGSLNKAGHALPGTRPEITPEAKLRQEAREKSIERILEDAKNMNIAEENERKAAQFKDAQADLDKMAGGGGAHPQDSSHTSKQFHETIAGSKTVNEAVGKFIDSGTGSEAARELARLLRDHDMLTTATLELTPEAKVDIGEGEKRSGGYWGDKHHVALGEGANYRTLLHEAVHATTHKLIEANSPGASRQLHGLFDKYTKMTQGRDGQANHYAFTNVHEFIAEAFTNREFQKHLQSFSLKDQSNTSVKAWNWFKDIVRKTLGVTSKEQRTGLDEVLDHGAKAIEKTRGYREPEEPHVEDQGTLTAPREGMDDPKYLSGQEQLANERRLIAEENRVAVSGDDTLETPIKAQGQRKAEEHPDYKAYEQILKDLENNRKHGREVQEPPTEPDEMDQEAHAYARRKTEPMRGTPQYRDAYVKARDEAYDALRTAAGKHNGKALGAPPSDGKPIIDKNPETVVSDKEATDVYRAIKKESGEEAAEFLNDYHDFKEQKYGAQAHTLNDVPDMFYKIQTTMPASDYAEIRKAHEDLSKSGEWTPEVNKALLDSLEQGIPMSPEHQAVAKKVLGKYLKEAQALAERGVKRGDIDELYSDYAPRYLTQSSEGSKLSDLFSNPETRATLDPSSFRDRKMFALVHPDGRRVVVEKDWAEVRWRKNEYGKDERYLIEKTKKGLTKGIAPAYREWVDGKAGGWKGIDDLGEFRPGRELHSGIQIANARTEEIEGHTGLEYVKDQALVQMLKTIEMRGDDRIKTVTKNFLDSALGASIAKPSLGQPAPREPDGTLWKRPEHVEKLPMFDGYYFPEKIANVITDFATSHKPTKYSKLTSFITNQLFLWPLPHIANEGSHFFVARGASGFFTVKGLGSLARASEKAWNSIRNVDETYREVLQAGGSFMAGDRHNKYFQQLLEPQKSKMEHSSTMQNLNSKLKSLGLAPFKFGAKWLELSNRAMWMSRDFFYMTLVHELKDKHGMTTEQAVKDAERHVPNYRLPSEIMGSRGLKQILANPNIAMFSRYHYGMVNSILNTGKELNPNLLRTEKGRETFSHGLDSLMAYGIGLSVLYPLMDVMAEAMFGDKAEQRRAGPFHLLHGITQAATGERDLSAAIWPILTFNPVLLSGMELLFNKNFVTGKPIYHPDDPVDVQAGDALHEMRDYNPLAKQYLSDPTSSTDNYAKLLDIQAPTPERSAMLDRSKKTQESKQRARERKRRKEGRDD